MFSHTFEFEGITYIVNYVLGQGGIPTHVVVCDKEISEIIDKEKYPRIYDAAWDEITR